MSRAGEKQTAIGCVYWNLRKLGVATETGCGQWLLNSIAGKRIPAEVVNALNLVLTEAVTKNVDQLKQKVKEAVGEKV